MHTFTLYLYNGTDTQRALLLLWQWSWKDLRTHFLLHCSDHFIARTFACRQLQTARYAVEQRLMRVDGETKELDKQGTELLLKLIKEESAQRSILQGISSGPGKKATGGSTVGDANK
jgi:hypothetical protein